MAFSLALCAIAAVVATARAAAPMHMDLIVQILLIPSTNSGRLEKMLWCLADCRAIPSIVIGERHRGPIAVRHADQSTVGVVCVVSVAATAKPLNTNAANPNKMTATRKPVSFIEL